MQQILFEDPRCRAGRGRILRDEFNHKAGFMLAVLRCGQRPDRALTVNV